MDHLVIAITGLLVGIVGGMFGIGGSIVLIPVLTELRGPNQHLYQATAMIMNLLVSVPAVVQHWRAGAIQASTIARLAPLSIVFVGIGVAISELPSFSGSGEARLRLLFGLFLLGCGIVELYRSMRPPVSGKADTSTTDDRQKSGSLDWPTVAAISAPTGFISGLLGIGGGIVAVPLQRRFLRMPLTIAIANSTALVAATALFGLAMKNYAYFHEHGSVAAPFGLAALLGPSAIVGSLLGARLTHRLPIRTLRGLFVVLLIVAAIRMVLGALPAPIQ